MQIEFRVLELLNSRLCHELISPVGAINNGVELMGEEDPDFVKDALGLVEQSAKRAGQRLQFYRFAYGAGGTGAGTPTPKELVAGILEGSRSSCEWDSAIDAMPVEWQKMACNLVLVASEALPRGGKVTLSSGEKKIVATAVADALNLTPEMRTAIGPTPDVAALGARTIHCYFTSRYAEKLEAKLTFAEADKTLVFTVA